MNVLRDAVWRHAAGLIRAEDLPMIAAEALARQVDSPSLRGLAGLSRRDRADEIVLLYRAAMDELGITVPTTEQAVARNCMTWQPRLSLAAWIPLRSPGASGRVSHG